MENLIKPSELAAMLDEPKTAVLDASWFMPGTPRDPEAEFAEAHIPGARRFDFDGAVKDKDSDLPHMLPPPSEFQQATRRLGISADSRIVGETCRVCRQTSQSHQVAGRVLPPPPEGQQDAGGRKARKHTTRRRLGSG